MINDIPNGTAREFIIAYARWIREIGNTWKLWVLSIGGYHSGCFKTFWTLRAAMRYYDAHSRAGLYIDLKNTVSGKPWRLRDNPNGVKPPPLYISRYDQR